MKIFSKHSHTFPDEVKKEELIFYSANSNDPLADRFEKWGYYLQCTGCKEFHAIYTRLEISRPLAEMWAAVEELKNENI